MSLARRHKAHHAALSAAAASLKAGGGLAPALADAPIAPIGDITSTGPGKIALARLIHDMRRLKEIKSVERKIDAKREMLPEYRDYISGVLSAAKASGQGVQDDVLITVMVWCIDTGAYHGALELADYVIRYGLSMPIRFLRTAACLVTEEISDAALGKLGRGETFDLDILLQLEDLVDGEDMPDEVRAKLNKAIGLELARQVADPEADNSLAGAQRARLDRGIAALKRALELDDRAGVKKPLQQLEALARKDPPAPADTTDTSQGAADAPPATDATSTTGAPPAVTG